MQGIRLTLKLPSGPTVSIRTLLDVDAISIFADAALALVHHVCRVANLNPEGTEWAREDRNAAIAQVLDG
jgi:hypothetical protein